MASAVTAKKLNALNQALSAAHHQPKGYEGRIRGRLHYYAFCQYLSGPCGYEVRGETNEERTSASHRLLMRLMLWTSFVILPGLTFLYFQIGFLPYHSSGMTWWHRLLLLADVALLWVFWPVIRYDKLKWRECFNEYPLPWKVAKVMATITIMFLSVFVATLPDETTDRWAASWWTVNYDVNRKIFRPTAWLFEGRVKDETRKPERWFSRNLVLVQKNLVDDDEKLDKGEYSLLLRNRDLRFAVLGRTDLHRADLAYAMLQGANLIGANLQNADLGNANLQDAYLAFANLSMANLVGANLIGATLSQSQLDTACGDKTTKLGEGLTITTCTLPLPE